MAIMRMEMRHMVTVEYHRFFRMGNAIGVVITIIFIIQLTLAFHRDQWSALAET